MAAPATKTIGDLSGKWVMNKSLSGDVKEVLALQGIGWMLRNTIGLATVTVDIKHYSGAPLPPNTSTDPVTRIDAEQTASGGLKGTSEHRSIDGVVRDHKDWLFGNNDAKSEWCSLEQLAAVAAKYGDFVAKNWIEGDAEKGGPNGETHIYNEVKNLDKKDSWTAIQIWGFQMIGGERRYTRAVVCENGGKKVNVLMVYDYVP